MTRYTVPPVAPTAPGELRVVDDAGRPCAPYTAAASAGFDAAFDDAFADPEVVLVHVRALEYGCFHFEVRRPSAGEPAAVPAV
ncbi:DUF1203 domain-containing protein [Streptomyces sp. NPDC047130]|uniref:DUF1203 domain-containing protein n=1 Tax=Streptomyces sp. NPDC047130 TaxID=3155261 RepID=UPI0033DD1904